MRGKWDAKNDPRDHGIARNFGSGLYFILIVVACFK